MGKLAVWNVVLIIGVVVGCSTQEPEPFRQAALSERQGLRPAPRVKLSFSSDCTEYEGNTACLSDLCLRLTPGFPPRGVCSQRCRPSDALPCPTRWECKQVWPSENGWVCAPPAPPASVLNTSWADGGAR